MTARAALRDAKRIVVKIGSSSIARSGKDRFDEVASAIVGLRRDKRSVIVVSSGAIAMGYERLGLKARPKAIALLQASAASGQSQLMRAYEDAFEKHGQVVAQVLLTHADLAERERYLNARAALEALMTHGAVPIINENDTVSVEEIKFGDNDQLAAMVASLIGADLLVLLTDVEGLLDASGARVAVVDDLEHASALVRPSLGEVGTGGMGSKVKAASIASRQGAPVVVADARDPDILAKIVAGEDVGTLFLPHGSPMASRKHWIGFTLKPKGAILIDDGAARAIATGRSSLLPRGVVGVRGDFESGDAVAIVGPDGKEVARGLSRYPIFDVARLAGARTDEIETRIGRTGEDEIVHLDDLVVL